MPGTGGKALVRKRTVKPSILRDIIRRVVEAAHPDKIIMFGSAARGEMGPNSDVDLLVIKGGKFDRWRLTTAIYRHRAARMRPSMSWSSHPRRSSVIATHIAW